MPFDGIVTAAVARELSARLQGGKIEKIYQPDSLDLLLHIHAKGGNAKLFLSCQSASPRIHLLEGNIQNPENPAAFCMLLRKHLQGGRIARIAQKDAERIIEIDVDTVNELGFSTNKRLLIEIMGKHSNIVLIEMNTGKIIDSIKRVSIDVNRVRQLLPGKGYEYPPGQGKTPLPQISKAQISGIINAFPGDAGKGLLANIQGLSPIAADSLAMEAEQGKAPPDAEQTAALWNALTSLQDALDQGCYTPSAYLDAEGLPQDFHIFPLRSLESGYAAETFETVSECIAYYYEKKSGASNARQKSLDLLRAIDNSLSKLRLKKQRLSEDLLRAESADTYRLFGELLTANLHLVSPGGQQIKVISYYDGSEVTIPLDLRLSPGKNAQAYFKKYAKAKTAVKEKGIQLAAAQSEIDYLESVQTFAENAQSPHELEELRNELVESGYLKKRKNQYKPAKGKPIFFACQTSGGFKVLAGKNNRENDLLTFKTADRGDIWLHTKDIPGSHVILSSGGRTPGENDLLEAASVAAYFSKARNSENVPVDYVPIRHVKKPAGAKPGMVIFTNNRTLFVHPKLPG